MLQHSKKKKRGTHIGHKVDGLSYRANTPWSLFMTTLDAEMERHLSTMQTGNEGREEEDGLSVTKLWSFMVTGG